ncbi:MAG: dTDP-4-dehydrorhamnose reductase, partial [Alphaproteobacteria bacterium]|nr:dTDP-4-dehydrorhamnose reductase [Alphaproteobacteria bacterium]
AGFVVTAPARRDLDVTDREAVWRAVEAARPRLVINAAAFTAVDAAESRPDEAFAINRDGVAWLAAACAGADIPLVHVSTDYVFDGAKGQPYVETDPVAPQGVYGASKEAGERALRALLEPHLIVRTSWVYDAQGRNFVRTMLRLGAERDRLDVVDDQWGAPTFADDLAGTLLAAGRRLIEAPEPALFGTFHHGGGGATTWYRFARAIFALAQAAGRKVPAEIVPIPTSAYPTPARRPADGRLDCGKFQRVHGIAPPPWEDALARAMPEILARS